MTNLTKQLLYEETNGPCAHLKSAAGRATTVGHIGTKEESDGRGRTLVRVEGDDEGSAVTTRRFVRCYQVYVLVRHPS